MKTRRAVSELDTVTDMRDCIRAVIECASQAAHDLVGEQRAFHLPRMQLAMKVLMTNYPTLALSAMETAVDGWGDPLVR